MKCDRFVAMGRQIQTKIIVNVFACVVWVGLTSCAGDETLVYLERPVEDIYNLAMDLLLDEDYDQAALTFEEVERQHP
ncbi:uncharacterized protein METZ01_LOCUS386629, partial [marine metagenome]